jgi:hypothetical protein
MSATEQVSLAERWLSSSELPCSGSVMQLWLWLTDPAQADTERTLFESCGRSLKRSEGGYARCARDRVTDWLPLIIRLLDHRPRAGSRGRHAAVRHSGFESASSDETHEADPGAKQTAATLVLAVLHGLLLDLLATGDHARTQDAFDLFSMVLDALTEWSDQSL